MMKGKYWLTLTFIVVTGFMVHIGMYDIAAMDALMAVWLIGKFPN